MSFRASLFRSLLPLLLTVLAFVPATMLRAGTAQGGFTATLSIEQKNATGIAALTPEEREALDQLVKAELAQARSEGSTELDGTFASRHTGEELHRAGLDRLTPEQLKKLDLLVAGAVAAGPKPRERPRLKDSDVLSPEAKPQVHGEASLTYGRTSGGGAFRGASFWVDYFDPKTGILLGVGISRFSGSGLWGFCPAYYDFGPGYGYDGGLGYYGYGPYSSSFSRMGRAGISDLDDRRYGRWDEGRETPVLSAFYRDFRRN